MEVSTSDELGGRLFFFDNLSFHPFGREHTHCFEYPVVGIAHAAVGCCLVIVALEVFPAVDVEAAFVVEAYVKIRSTPAKSVSVSKRGRLAFFHLRSTMGAVGCFLDLHSISR